MEILKHIYIHDLKYPGKKSEQRKKDNMISLLKNMERFKAAQLCEKGRGSINFIRYESPFYRVLKGSIYSSFDLF